jgi:hypothetical protein
VAQKCASVCGDTTRQQLKERADDPVRWSTYLVKQLIGPQRTTLQAALAQYSAPEVDQLQWEAAAAGLGLRQVHIPYAAEAGVSPGAQLFVLAQTLFGLGLYASLGTPNGNAEIWKDSIRS